jgi:hypothetical protein
MNLSFENNGHVECPTNLDAGLYVYETEIDFPCTFVIKTSGKQSLDTVVDADGNIIDDLFIRLDDINIDGLSCHSTYLHEKIFLHTDSGESIQANYWGFNGQVKLDLAYPDSLHWALSCVDFCDHA